MPRVVTLFTGQWADLSLSELAPKAKAMGFDGLELACWGDHLDVQRGAVVRADGVETRAVTVHLPVELARQLRVEAAEQGVSVSRLIEQRLQQS